MQTAQGEFRGARGMSTYFQTWQPDSAARALVIVAHGAAEHSGRYEGLAHFLTDRGFAVAALDHAGHGRSEGTPGFVESFDDFVETLHFFRTELQGIADGAPRFLLGHSMGGLIAAKYLLKYQDGLAGCVLSGPAIATDVQPGFFQLLMVRLLSFVAPRAGALQLDAEGVSRDPAEVAKYRADPMVYTGELSARLVAEIFRSMNTVQQRAAEIHLPMLIMHGSDDVLTAPSGSKYLHEHIASEDKVLKIYPGLYHEIFNEPEKEAVMEELAQWLDQHLPAA